MKSSSTSPLRITHKRLIILSLGLIAIGCSILLHTTIADDGFAERYERVYSNGLIEISPVPFNDSSYSQQKSTFKDINTKAVQTNPNVPLDVMLTITEPQSVGVTHAYIPVSTFGSTCTMIESQVKLTTHEITQNTIESKIIHSTPSNNREVVRIGDLTPDTLYTYRIFALGCAKTASSYERSFITLPDPTTPVSEYRIHKQISTISPYADMTTQSALMNVVIARPRSIGITHAYIPISVKGSTCSNIVAHVEASSGRSGTIKESTTAMLDNNDTDTVRLGDLLPQTRYSYKIIAYGCGETVTTYEREFTTLPDPTRTEIHVPSVPTSSGKIPTSARPTPTTIYQAPVVLQPANEIPAYTTTPSMNDEKPVNVQNPDDSTVGQEMEAEPFEDIKETEFKKDRKIKLPTTAREWIALALLLVGTIGIIASFIQKKTPKP